MKANELVLVKGAPYHISINGTESPPKEKIYVMPQFLFPTGKYWETFFSIVEEQWIYRTDLPKKNITGIIDGTIIAEGGLITTFISPDNKNREPLIEGWLIDVKEIMMGMGLQIRDSPAFINYFR